MRVKVTTLLVMIFCCSFVFLTSCGGKKGVREELLTEQQKQAERDAIVEVLNHYFEAAQERSWSKMVSTLADEVTFFGTDSGEVSRSFNDFKNSMQRQWEEYETFEYGKIQDLYIELDDYARYANAIFGTPLTFGRAGEEPQTVFAIFQRTLNKHPINKNWQIKSGILTIARTQ